MTFLTYSAISNGNMPLWQCGEQWRARTLNRPCTAVLYSIQWRRYTRVRQVKLEDPPPCLMTWLENRLPWLLLLCLGNSVNRK